MLNHVFSKSITGYDDSNYILDEKTILHIIKANEKTSTGKEWRLQDVYGYEIFKKIDILGLRENDFINKTVLDVCCGSGFLSYHLLKKLNFKDIVLLDISKSELYSAKQLLDQTYPYKNLSYMQSNAIKTGFKDETFDIIIGNSFLHHFYNLPLALIEFNRILKKGGVFLSLHEPTASAFALERGSLLLMAKNIFLGDRYIDLFRYNGPGIAPGGGQDVWIFNEEDKLYQILINSGMYDISINHFHLLRSFFIGKFAIHLNENKPTLSKRESFCLKKCIDLDVTISPYIPKKLFGSIAIKATKQKHD